MGYPACGMVHMIERTLDANRKGREEGRVLFNAAFHTFYLQLYGIRHMVRNNSDRERERNLLLLHGLLFLIGSKGSFICIIPQTG